MQFCFYVLLSHLFRPTFSAKQTSCHRNTCPANFCRHCKLENKAGSYLYIYINTIYVFNSQFGGFNLHLRHLPAFRIHQIKGETFELFQSIHR